MGSKLVDAGYIFLVLSCELHFFFFPSDKSLYFTAVFQEIVDNVGNFSGDVSDHVITNNDNNKVSIKMILFFDSTIKSVNNVRHPVFLVHMAASSDNTFHMQTFHTVSNLI